MAVICIELLQSEAALLDIKLLGKSKGHAFYVLRQPQWSQWVPGVLKAHLLNCKEVWNLNIENDVNSRTGTLG